MLQESGDYARSFGGLRFVLDKTHRILERSARMTIIAGATRWRVTVARSREISA